MPAQLEMFPTSYLDLNKELIHHPNLQLNPEDDFEIKLAKIAAYCEVILDGYYTEADLNVICERLTAKLYNSRRQI